MPESEPEERPRKRRERFHGRIDRDAPCARPGCDEPGEFRAPIPGAPAGTWQYFCLDHVREFNAGYRFRGGRPPSADDRWERGWQTAGRGFSANAYAGAFVDELGIFARGSFAGASAARWTPAERDALQVMDLGESASAADIRTRYKALVRRFHPDMNGGDRSHEARLQAVLDAYSELKQSQAFTV
ncbi:MAG: J domain-containing protein [Pseudomonadota bacterium]